MASGRTAAVCRGQSVGTTVQAAQHQRNVAQIMRETGFDPQYLELELTESILMEDASATISALDELKAIGVQSLAMDDFGTGYSSLSYLQRIPITTVKIDRSFIRDVDDQSQQRGDRDLDHRAGAQPGLNHRRRRCRDPGAT